MARTEKSESNKTFFRITDGSLCEKSNEERPGYQVFKTNNPQTGEEVTYYLKRYSNLEGTIKTLTRVQMEDKKIFGWNLEMQDEEGDFSIFFKEGARTTNRLLKVFENINLDEPVVIGVWKDAEGKAAITFKQNGENISQKWNTENLPEVKKVRGKWDYSVHDNFLYDHFMSNVIPTLPILEKAKAATASTESAEEAEAEDSGADDVIPF